MQYERKMARFSQYAMAATEEALADADWKPGGSDLEKREMTVRFCAGPWETLLC